MPYPTCRHIKEDGHLCQSPAMHQSHYCYFHDNHRARRMKIAQARARGERIWLDLPPLDDMRAVQAAISQVIEAIAADVIELKRARALLTALRLAANNFKSARAWGDRSQFEVDEWHESVASYPELAAEYGLPPNTDLDADPEEVFPPPKAKPGAVPVARLVGHRRSAVGCHTVPGIIDTCKELGPDDQLMMLREMAGAFAQGMGKRPPTSSATNVVELTKPTQSATGGAGA
jgi:hypothetical protein